MSISQLQAFVEACDVDQVLQLKIKSIGEDYEAIIAIGSSLGFEFSAEDLRSFKSSKADEEIDEELPLEELATVAVGGKYQNRWHWCFFVRRLPWHASDAQVVIRSAVCREEFNSVRQGSRFIVG